MLERLEQIILTVAMVLLAAAIVGMVTGCGPEDATEEPTPLWGFTCDAATCDAPDWISRGWGYDGTLYLGCEWYCVKVGDLEDPQYLTVVLKKPPDQCWEVDVIMSVVCEPAEPTE